MLNKHSEHILIILLRSIQTGHDLATRCENLPPNTHHVGLTLIDYAILDENQWSFARTKDRSVFRELDIMRKMGFRSW